MPRKTGKQKRDDSKSQSVEPERVDVPVPPSVQAGFDSPNKEESPAPSDPQKLTLPSSKPKDSTIEKMKLLKIKDEDIEKHTTHALIPRPKIRGKKGRKIRLYANYYPVKLEPLHVFHYDMAVWRRNSRAKKFTTKKNDENEDVNSDWVAISRLPRFLAVLLLNKLYAKNEDIFSNRYGLAFDGQKNLISSYKLDVDMPKEFIVQIDNPEKQVEEEFKIELQLVSEIDVDIERVFDPDLRERKSIATLVYDIVLKQSYFYDTNMCIPCGRRIFYYPETATSLGGGSYCFPGIWQSLRPVDGWKVMINQDLAHTAFIPGGSVLKLLKNQLDCRSFEKRIPDLEMLSRKLEKVVKGLKITQTQRAAQRTSKCEGVSIKSANELEFTIEKDGKSYKTTIYKYFIEQYKNRIFTSEIRYPHLMCLKFSRNNWIPVEFCEIKPGQRYTRKLDSSQTSKMILAASKKANERKQLIEADMTRLNMNENEYFQQFGISVSNEMVKFDGRVLPSPTILYKNDRTVTVQDGSWKMEKNHVIHGCVIRNFAILKTCHIGQNKEEETFNKTEFIKAWLKCAYKMGIKIESDDAVVVKKQLNAKNIANELNEMKNQYENLDLVFVVLEAQNTDHYAHAKRAGDVTEGINTQCILAKNFILRNDSTLSNLNLKINGKLGGVNSVISAQNMKSIADWVNDEIMYMGADVNHDAPDDSNEEPISCAAIVASVDNSPSKYCARIFLQHQERITANGVTRRRPQEWIANMHEGVQMALENYLRCRKCLPRRIIMYRDGVGETMFGLVLERELASIHQACTAFAERNSTMLEKWGVEKGKPYEPPVTFIVVQKRHHSRLFCVDDEDAMTRYGKNVPPGTTVDTTITHPVEFDFFLCSHLGLQGTSKPAHYHVLSDDNNFSADELQTLTNYLCYTYCRSTRSVSIPPPCYYADLVAFRARQYLKAIFDGGSESASQLSGASNRNRMSLNEMQNLVNVNINIVQKGMYFV